MAGLANRQLINFLAESVRIGECLLQDPDDIALFDAYQTRIAELVEYLGQYRHKMNLLVSWKTDKLQLYDPTTDYRPRIDRLLDKARYLLRRKKESFDNKKAYIQQQNLIMATIEFYYRHQS